MEYRCWSTNALAAILLMIVHLANGEHSAQVTHDSFAAQREEYSSWSTRASGRLLQAILLFAREHFTQITHNSLAAHEEEYS